MSHNATVTSAAELYCNYVTSDLSRYSVLYAVIWSTLQDVMFLELSLENNRVKKKSDIILTVATCCYGIKSAKRNDGNYLTHRSTQIHWVGVQLCHQTIFPSYTRFISFLPSLVSYFPHVSLFFSVSPFPSFLHLFLCFSFSFSSLSPSLYFVIFWTLP